MKLLSALVLLAVLPASAVLAAPVKLRAAPTMPWAAPLVVEAAARAKPAAAPIGFLIAPHPVTEKDIARTTVRKRSWRNIGAIQSGRG